MLYTILIVFHVVLAAALIAIVLVQRGPGATMGAAFGAGASGTVFGSRGSASFLSRTTTWLGIAFFAISLSMAVIAARSITPVVPTDDLGVAGTVTAQPADAEPAGADDEFLTLPIEGDEAVATEAAVDAAAQAEAPAVQDETSEPVEAEEPPQS
ncbi:preprotein translocase subunit SecG [Wenzhouxiangella marina]|uniref:Protein-export membrane protein SecG n=1 Tax=Wenzhouxiangella marina TaxID=1579979 RepID=A0A0K0XTJ6_9GAMM|nr:preprotein translocase subunit SecG [Wenzhouxiangella marina]AKS40980.1 hypothetical protein WM2015_598 [Wenzhouxiangella marina]MBB6087854.1 preprotein translocase subunit SecG [Wenzhouxiangella marina]